MKKKKFILVATTCALAAVGCVCAVSAIALNNGGISLSRANKDPYSLVLNKDNAFTEDEHNAKAFTRGTTTSGRPITFKTYGGTSFAPSTDNFAIARDTNAWFYNESPLNGLEKITIRCSAKKFKVFYFNKEVNENRNNYVACSDEMTGAGGSTDVVISIPRFEDPIKYIVWQQTETANNWIASIKFEFSCTTTLENRGNEFVRDTGSGVTFTISETPETTGSVTTDVKWTDISQENAHMSIGLFSSGWKLSFGYKNVYPTTKTGDIPGLTVIPLSDGYTRLVWKLSEMVVTPSGERPTSITIVHIHQNDWTTASGYLDVNPNDEVNVIEYYGEKLTSSVNTSFTYESVTLAGKILQVDIYFDSTCAEGDKSAFYIANNNGCAEYYGNFNLYRNKVDDASGLTFVKRLTNGYSRFTIDLDAVTKGSTTKPTTSIYSYSRGNWSTASGYIAIQFITK